MLNRSLQGHRRLIVARETSMSGNTPSVNDSELVIGLVGAIGTDLDRVIKIITDRLRAFHYGVSTVRVSKDVIQECFELPDFTNKYETKRGLMRAGNQMRLDSGDSSLLAKGVASRINYIREHAGGSNPRKAYIVNSLKHPKEVECLKEIYGLGYFTIGVFAEEDRRRESLTRNNEMSTEEANDLIAIDMDEHLNHGQSTRDTYQLSDFFVYLSPDEDCLVSDIHRFLDLMFGNPFITPTFDEYAMFMAFSSSLKSAELARQVGAVITKSETIVASGANDVPRFGGGQYWPCRIGKSIEDAEKGRDWKRGWDSNTKEKMRIVSDILEQLRHYEGVKVPRPVLGAVEDVLNRSGIGDITEYGRSVHAEMDALLSCARNGISTHSARLCCTTFPCHNCAKHIVAAGIDQVVYIEPYPKSKAPSLHDDSIIVGMDEKEGMVLFRSFIGVGPRRFFDLFSMNLGFGYRIKRKDNHGDCIKWDTGDAALRTQLRKTDYQGLERVAAQLFDEYLERIGNDQTTDESSVQGEIRD